MFERTALARASLTKCIRTAGERGSRRCAHASWRSAGPHDPPCPLSGPAGPPRSDRAISRTFHALSVARNDSASNVGDRPVARLAKVALKFTPLSLSHSSITTFPLRRRFRCHYARYYGRSRLRAVRARGPKRVTSHVVTRARIRGNGLSLIRQSAPIERNYAGKTISRASCSRFACVDASLRHFLVAANDFFEASKRVKGDKRGKRGERTT